MAQESARRLYRCPRQSFESLIDSRIIAYDPLLSLFSTEFVGSGLVEELNLS